MLRVRFRPDHCQETLIEGEEQAFAQRVPTAAGKLDIHKSFLHQCPEADFPL